MHHSAQPKAQFKVWQRWTAGEAACKVGGGWGAVHAGHAERAWAISGPDLKGGIGCMDCITLFLCGDVMTGRGIDQILAHPVRPHLFEPYVRSAQTYVSLAEARNGPIPRLVASDYIWGDARRELERVGPDARIINLETSVTCSEDAWPARGIHYRMHPDNVPILTAVGIDCCVLANNHVLDWGYEGLTDTLRTLVEAGVCTAGAGRDNIEAAAPAIIELAGGGRVLVFAFATDDSGVAPDWAADKGRPGVNRLNDLSAQTVRVIATQVRAVRRDTDVVVASIHWGPNFCFAIPPEQQLFAHSLIESAGVDVVHGHSSHHVKGIEVYRGKLILYGAGDFINDYEGIGGHERYRCDLALMYFPVIDLATGKLIRLTMTPTQIRRFCVNLAPEEGIGWLAHTLNREGERLGSSVERGSDDTFVLRVEA
ncbi:poly-gamma-glutamate capsule biosynthesis protein CapA/YwtB (metallophosphatase superfamily) [Paraburkholderia youngii]|uniref:CapA family protein n=1 Tax=Paraburkholderia youngii TaxID=2782701 RepID=UPI003D1B579D